MLGWEHELMMREKYKSLLREAERERLARQARAENQRRPPLLAGVRAWMQRAPIAAPIKGQMSAIRASATGSYSTRESA